MELQRGMIVERGESTKLFLVAMTSDKLALVIDLYGSEKDALSDLRQQDGFGTDAFICQFHCKELVTSFSFLPKFSVRYRTSPTYRLVTQIEERSITSVLISLSSIIIPKEESYRIFMCADSGEHHKMGYWNNPKVQEEFVSDYTQSGVEYTARKYSLSEVTCQGYYRKFSKSLGIRKPIRSAGFWDDPEIAKEFIDIYNEKGIKGVCEEFEISRTYAINLRTRCYRILGITPKRRSKVITSPEIAKKFLEDCEIYRSKFLAERYGIDCHNITYYRQLANKILQESSEE